MLGSPMRFYMLAIYNVTCTTRAPPFLGLNLEVMSLLGPSKVISNFNIFFSIWVIYHVAIVHVLPVCVCLNVARSTLNTTLSSPALALM